MRISDWSSDVCSSDLHAADHLDVVMALPEHALGGLAHRGEGFGQQIVEAFPGLDPLAKAKRLVLEIILAHRRNGRLEGVDLVDSRSERLDVAIVRGTEDGLDRKSTRLNSSHQCAYSMPTSA